MRKCYVVQKAQEKQEEKKLNDEKRKREWRKKQIDNIKDGKKPYFLKQCKLTMYGFNLNLRIMHESVLLLCFS